MDRGDNLENNGSSWIMPMTSWGWIAGSALEKPPGHPPRSPGAGCAQRCAPSPHIQDPDLCTGSPGAQGCPAGRRRTHTRPARSGAADRAVAIGRSRSGSADRTAAIGDLTTVDADPARTRTRRAAWPRRRQPGCSQGVRHDRLQQRIEWSLWRRRERRSVPSIPWQNSTQSACMVARPRQGQTARA